MSLISEGLVWICLSVGEEKPMSLEKQCDTR